MALIFFMHEFKYVKKKKKIVIIYAFVSNVKVIK